MSKLKMVILEKDARIGQLLSELEELRRQQPEAVEVLQATINELKDQLDKAVEQQVDAVARAIYNMVTRGNELDRIVNRLCVVSRNKQIESTECGDPVNAAIMEHEFNTILMVIELIKSWRPDFVGAELQEPDEDPWDEE